MIEIEGKHELGIAVVAFERLYTRAAHDDATEGLDDQDATAGATATALLVFDEASGAAQTAAMPPRTT